MFGDNYMAFRQEVAVDEKYRIFIPSKTGVEKGEILYLTYSSDMTHFIISKAKYILTKIEQLQKACLDTKDIELYQELTKDREYFSGLIIQILKVDSQKRVLLGKEVTNQINPCSNVIYLSGQIDEIHIFKNKEQYQELYGHTI